MYNDKMKEMNGTRRLGIYKASGITNTQMTGIIFREQREEATGLNAHIEFSDGRISGIRLYVSNECEKSARGYICTGVVYEHERSRILYELMTTENIEITGTSYEILIPYDGEYNSSSYERITNQTCTSPYLARLAIAKTWMELIRNDRGIYIELEEWINQPDTHGTLRLIVNGPDGGVYQWPFTAPDNKPHVMCLPSLFPWADIRMDEEYYRSVNLHEPKEPEGNELLPYTIECGEIAKFRFRLELNSLGHAFLSSEPFICRGIYPSMHNAVSYGPDYEGGLKYQLYTQKKNI